jgi:hypothetical protein
MTLRLLRIRVTHRAVCQNRVRLARRGVAVWHKETNHSISFCTYGLHNPGLKFKGGRSMTAVKGERV